MGQCSASKARPYEVWQQLLRNLLNATLRVDRMASATDRTIESPAATAGLRRKRVRALMPQLEAVVPGIGDDLKTADREVLASATPPIPVGWQWRFFPAAAG